jgi:cytochrome P450
VSVERPTVDFDHYDEAFARDPYPKLRELRERCPVAHTDAHGGFWVVSRYDDVCEIARDPDVFSSRYVTVPTDIGYGEDVRLGPLQFDPPEHTRLKRLLATAFVPAKVAPLAELTRETIIGLLEPHLATGSFDGSDDFARHVPTAVVCQILGLPPTLTRFTDWVERVIEPAADDLSGAMEAVGEILLFLMELVADRRANPGSDILSYLVEAELEGERLTDEDIINTCAVILLAGIDTTWSMLGCVLHYLGSNPAEQQYLRDHPELVPTATEEFLRAFAPVTLARQVRVDTVFHGQAMRAGEMVMISFPSANRDDAAFDQPDAVRLDRQPNRHLAFGTGIHKCLGSNVARMEVQLALEELLRLVPPFRVADDTVVTWSRGPVRGPRSLPIVFEPVGVPTARSGK